MRHIDIHKLGDDARFTRLHAIVLAMCTLVIIFDGYDLAVAGIALPSIMKEMGIKATSAGFMVSTALFGMMFGAVIFGTIADRIGRRWTIAACVLLFSVFTAAAGFARDPVTFGAFRFVAGLGIGGVMPNVVAQMSEYSPRKIRSTMVTLMFSGYSVGGMLAALLGKGLIERFGWQSVFIAAGLPVLLIPFVLRMMPESMAFLLRTGRTDALRSIAARLVPDYVPQEGDRFVLSDGGTARATPIGKLFQDGRAFGTVMLWIAFFMCLFMVYALSSWLAKLMASAGYTLGFGIDVRAGAEPRRDDRRDRRRVARGSLQHQACAGLHVCARRRVDHVARLQDADAGTVLRGRTRRCVDDRYADSHLRICGAVLSAGDPIDGNRLGVGVWPKRGNSRADHHRHSDGNGVAAEAELRRHCGACGDCHDSRSVHG